MAVHAGVVDDRFLLDRIAKFVIVVELIGREITQVRTWNNGKQPPCGKGWYWNGTWAHFLNGNWVGGHMPSGFHWIELTA